MKKFQWQLNIFLYCSCSGSCVKTPILLVAVAIALVLLSGCESSMLPGKLIPGAFGSSITLSFIINDTGRPLDGSVLLGGRLLGNTTNGTLVLDREILAPGALTFSRTDHAGNSYEFYFSLDASDLVTRRINFRISQADYEEAIFDASSLDTKRIEGEIFRLANEERAKAGIKPLRLDGRVERVAEAYSKVLSIEGFHHTDAGGKDVKDRFNDAGIIFLVAGENLFSSSSVTAKTGLAKEAVDGWLKSPGHRATLLDRDGIYSDAGVGVYCAKKDCFVVMNFAALLQEQKTSLERGWVTFHYLNNPGYGFAPGAIPVRFELSASAPVNVYIVPSYASYRDFTNGREITKLQEFKGTTRVNTLVEAEPGTGAIIEAESGGSDVSFSVDFKGGS